eukprot:1141602-Pleurochrysis_carterae.AAC.1
MKNVYGRDAIGQNYNARGRKSTQVSALVGDRGVPHVLFASTGNRSFGLPSDSFKIVNVIIREMFRSFVQLKGKCLWRQVFSASLMRGFDGSKYTPPSCTELAVRKVKPSICVYTHTVFMHMSVSPL